MNDLNLQQTKATHTLEGPVLISAGPGTGKTRTFAHRIVHLLTDKKINPHNILAVTFTRSAALKMKDRIQTLFPSPSLFQSLWVDTFHAIASKILKEEGYPYGKETPFSLIDEEKKEEILKDFHPKKERSSFLRDLQRQKQNLIKPSSEMAQKYHNLLKQNHMIDFDDLFLLVLELFKNQSTIQSSYKNRFQWIMVDEFQDTSLAQYQFLKSLGAKNLCVIGDPDQAIYGFTSQNFKPFEEFKKDYPHTKVLSLSENYRSQETIVNAAKQVIQKNQPQIPRELTARLEKGLPIEIIPHQSDRQEAEITVRKIEGLLGGASHFTIDSQWAQKEEETYTYGLNDIAILYRFHAQAKLFETALNRAGLPFITYGKKKNTQEEITQTQIHPHAESISLMTLHRAKGLEFSVVFIVGCEDGILPFQKEKEPSRLEEERRLFYVGMTRAKNRLFLSHAKKRFLNGLFFEKGPSPFLSDIEQTLRIIQENKDTPKKRPHKKVQLSLFDGL